MDRFYTKIIGTPVREGDAPRPITTVKEVWIDPSNGNLCALEVNYGKNMVITPMDIISWHDAIVINDSGNIVSSDEILRVDEVINQDIRVHKSRVESKSGVYMGNVYDFSIGNNDFALKKLFVAKDILGLARYDKRIINAKEIVEILEEKIIVKSDKSWIKEGEEKEISVEEMAKA